LEALIDEADDLTLLRSRPLLVLQQREHEIQESELCVGQLPAWPAGGASRSRWSAVELPYPCFKKNDL